MQALPTRLLNSWLKSRAGWQHVYWLELLELLRDNGLAEFADTDEGQRAIGFYLEQKKNRVLKLKKGG